MTDLDAALHSAGQRWRADLQADPSLDELFAAPYRRRNRGQWIATAAAAVVIAVLAGALVVARVDRNHRTSAGGGRQRCESEFTAARTSFRPDSGRGGLTATLRLTYAGATSCVISSYGPTVDLLDRSGALVAEGSDSSLVLLKPETRTVTRGDVVTTAVSWSTSCPRPRSVVTTVRLFLRAAGARESGGVDVPVSPTAAPACDRHLTGPPSNSFVVPREPHVTQNSATARVAVGIEYAGGPAPGTSSRLEAGTVTFRRRGALVARVTTPDKARRPVALEPGTYQVSATSGDASCIPTTVTAVAGRTTALTVVCSVK